MSRKKLQLFLKGKIFLIGLTFVDNNENIIEQYQTSGTVDELTDDGFIKFCRKDRSIFYLPYYKENINIASEGEYRERTTGKIIVNPDYITSWTVTIKSLENIEKIKQQGFLPQEWTLNNEKNLL